MTRYSRLADRCWLHCAYVHQRRSASSIAAELGCSTSLVLSWLYRWGIPVRPAGARCQRWYLARHS